MRRASALAVLATIAAAAMMLVGTSSAAGPESARATVAKAKARGFVTQIGLRNYAGQHCPGVSWNCTKSKRVFQIAQAGGENIAQCNASGTTPVITASGQTCSITQTGTGTSTNYAKCYERSKAVPAAVQECTIDQTGASNTAIVDQLIVQTQGSTQTGTQKATVTQGAAGTGSSVLNSSSVSQDVKQNTAGSGSAAEDNAEEPNLAASGGPQVQDAYQTAKVTQVAAGSGRNDSSVDQSEWQKAHGGSSQKQNASAGTENCGIGSAEVANPNVCANVEQTSGSGTNASRLRQSVDERAKLLVVGSQTQGSSDGGAEGRVHQETDPGAGSSSSSVNQSKQQELSAPATSSQTQFDPISCCGFFSQEGGTGNAETITQSADLRASEGDLAVQHVDLIGQSNSEFGSCTFDQHATVNTGSESQTETVPPPCSFQEATISCTSGPAPPPVDILLTEADFVIQQEEDGPCVASPPTDVG